MSLDLVIRGGTVVDGSGAPAVAADVAVAGDRIVGVGTVSERGAVELPADGLVVAPGFVNVLSHAYVTLQQDPRGLSDLYQGVTTEVFGEGVSLGPVTGRMKEIFDAEPQQGGITRTWPTLAGFLDHLADTGVGPNVASFVGAHNLRMIHAGADDRPLSDEELRAATQLLDEELRAGALGVGSALIYSPGNYASTAELTAFAEVIARHDALYVSHIRSEGDALLEAIEELLTVARDAGCRAEVYHLKASGRHNWAKMAQAVDALAAARADGVVVTADIYPYEAGATRLAASVPPLFHAGGEAALQARLADPQTRAAIKDAIGNSSPDWENLYLGSGGAPGVLVLGAPGTDHAGRTLADVSVARGDGDPVDTLLDIVAEDPMVLAVYFGMSEENIRLGLAQPWVSVCSDAEAPAAEPPFLDTPVHPRSYGSFARILGRYVREEGLLTIEDAVRRMSALPAQNLRLRDRGSIRVGALADLAVFDAASVRDRATYQQPHRYADGMRHVVINGRIAFRDGTPTGTLAGRALYRGR